MYDIHDYQCYSLAKSRVRLVEGKFPKRALNLVMEWYEIHQEELLQDWELIRTTGEYNKIQPLE